MISSVAVLDPASARALAVTRSPAAPASAQAPASSAFRRDTPIPVMSILLFQFLGLVTSGVVLSVEKENGGRPDLRDLSLLKVEENHAGPDCPPIPRW